MGKKEPKKCGIELVSDTMILWWITCSRCGSLLHGLAHRDKWLNLDPVCWACPEGGMMIGLTSFYSTGKLDIPIEKRDNFDLTYNSVRCDADGIKQIPSRRPK